MIINTIKETMPRTSNTMTNGDDQANEEPPLEIGMRMNIVAARLVNAPRKSTFFNFDLRDPVTGFKGRKKMI
jgi:hypothetical protein